MFIEPHLQKLNLVHHTALAFTVQHNNQQIQQLREQYDPAFKRWQPHINFCFPFVDTPQFPHIFDVLQDRLKTIPPFQICFKKMDSFSHGTIFLVPQTKGNELQNIYNIIVETIPQLKSNKDFHPHMTVGKFGKGQIQAKKHNFNNKWKQWIVKCDGLSIIQRGKDTPFKTYKKIQFKGQ